MKKLMLIGVLAILPVFSGCSSLGVEAWDRDLLAKDEMLIGGDGLDASLDDHIYFSKEGTSGGRGFAGGGCGCN